MLGHSLPVVQGAVQGRLPAVGRKVEAVQVRSVAVALLEDPEAVVAMDLAVIKMVAVLDRTVDIKLDNGLLLC